MTPSSQSSTLRRNNETKTQTLSKNAQIQPPIYDSIATKPTQTSLATAQSINGGKINIMNSTIGQQAFTGNNSVLNSAGHAQTILSSAIAACNNRPIDYSSYERNTLDYRHLNSNHDSNKHHFHTMAPPSTHNQVQQNHLVEFRQKTNGPKLNDEYRLSSGSDLILTNNTEFLNLSNSSIANQLLPGGNNGGNCSNVPIVPSRMHSATLNSSKDANRNHHNNNRSHIITDSLPGPESCV